MSYSCTKILWEGQNIVGNIAAARTCLVLACHHA